MFLAPGPSCTRCLIRARIILTETRPVRRALHSFGMSFQIGFLHGPVQVSFDPSRSRCVYYSTPSRMAEHSTEYGEIEIGLHRVEPGVCDVEVRVTDPGSQAEISPARGRAVINPEELRLSAQNVTEYGELLTNRLFASPEVRNLFLTSRSALERSGYNIRLRLLIGPTAPELNAVRWELLIDPETRLRLSTSERILFSRVTLSRDWRLIRLRPKSELRAAVAVSGPTNLGSYNFGAVDANGEIERALHGLAGIRIVSILGREEPATLDRLAEILRDGVDILYLVCHGVYPESLEPALFLEKHDRTTDVVLGSRLAEIIHGLADPPRLIVLASCNSAGTDSSRLSAHASMAPRLADAGVPAVLAMQGKVTMETVALGMPVFFRELVRDGQIDRAMAVSRAHTQHRFDNWAPALFLRLKSGRLWYEPGFAGRDDDFAKWDVICQRIKAAAVLPVVGPELAESVLGRVSEVSQAIAKRHEFPMPASDRADLARVAQFLVIEKDANYAQTEVQRELRDQVLTRCRHLLQPGCDELPLEDLLDQVAQRQREDESAAVRILADLPVPLYINAGSDTLLFSALDAAGKFPRPIAAEWRPTPEVPSPVAPVLDSDPTVQSPLLYHVFGSCAIPSSWVLTEDDFLDFALRTSQYKLIPAPVRGLLTRSSLLFLGFSLNSWHFRVLFRLIMSQEGCHLLKQYSHIGVQIDPEDNNLDDVRKARKYLKDYFNSSREGGRGFGEPRIDVYWGSPADFLNELRRQLELRKDEPHPAKLVRSRFAQRQEDVMPG